MYADFCPSEPGRGPFRGNEPLRNSSGENAFGYWRLGVENNGSGSTGVVNGFSLTITGTVLSSPAIGPNTIVSTSSFQSGTSLAFAVSDDGEVVVGSSGWRFQLPRSSGRERRKWSN